MILGVVQVSMGSQRLPKKAALPILGKPMTWWVYTRLWQARSLDKVVLAFPEDDVWLVRFAREHQIPYYAGSYRDLIDRLYCTTLAFGADAIVRVTGDCPMVDPDVVDRVVEMYLQVQSKVGCVMTSGFPAGLNVSVYSREFLRRLWFEIDDPVYREWFTAYINLHEDRFSTFKAVRSGAPLSSLRWTVDYPEDLEFVRCIYDQLGSNFRMRDVLDLLEIRPTLAQINAARQIDPLHNFPYKGELSD